MKSLLKFFMVAVKVFSTINFNFKLHQSSSSTTKFSAIAPTVTSTPPTIYIILNNESKVSMILRAFSSLVFLTQNLSNRYQWELCLAPWLRCWGFYVRLHAQQHSITWTRIKINPSIGVKYWRKLILISIEKNWIEIIFNWILLFGIKIKGNWILATFWLEVIHKRRKNISFDVIW